MRVSNINTAFTRNLLSQVHADVRKAFPQVGDLMKAASVTGDRRNQFVQIQFPGVEDFDYEANASDFYEARYKAWCAFLRKHGVHGFKGEDQP